MSKEMNIKDDFGPQKGSGQHPPGWRPRWGWRWEPLPDLLPWRRQRVRRGLSDNIFVASLIVGSLFKRSVRLCLWGTPGAPHLG